MQTGRWDIDKLVNDDKLAEVDRLYAMVILFAGRASDAMDGTGKFTNDAERQGYIRGLTECANGLADLLKIVYSDKFNTDG